MKSHLLFQSLEKLLQDFSVPSPTATISTPISIARCPTVSLGVSEVQTPLFTDLTSTNSSTTVETQVTVNTFDAGA